MDLFQAIILGLIQGLTEFLPVSSSGHIELGKAILGVEIKENLLFTVILHGATALSTTVVFRKEIFNLLTSFFTFKTQTEEFSYALKLIISMVPVGIVGLAFESEIESLFSGNILLVGAMLMVTGLLLGYASRTEARFGELSYFKAIVIGIAQAIAILPGISRSGATICTGLLLGVKRQEVSKFSFLMVLAPIMGASLLKLKDYLEAPAASSELSATVILAGAVTAFIFGYLACKWMIQLVNRGRLLYFSLYCLLAGGIAILFSIL
jgi:undecaprenyl-diphosphatase